jgi:hypothetical protein
VESVTLSATEITCAVGDTIDLTFTLLPADAVDKEVSRIVGNNDVVDVSWDGKLIAVAPGKCKITVQAIKGGAAACCLVTVVAPQVDGHGYIDLGLPSGTLWATCNIGADNPEDSGLYFAWGDTIGHTIGDGYSFQWLNNYKYGYTDFVNTNPDGSPYFVTKYSTDSAWGCDDDLTELVPSDDAAYVKWSANWRMPTKAQVEELMNSDYTNAVWTKQNGVNGYRITSKVNGTIIFLPAAGYGLISDLVCGGELGLYWTRTLNQSIQTEAYKFFFQSDGIECNTENRSCGLPVRPVTVKE